MHHSRVFTFVACILSVTVLGCAGSSKPEPPGPARSVRELTSNDTVFRSINLAAAGYLKALAPAARIGFTGVYINRLEVHDISNEIIRRFGFIRPSTSMRIGIACVRVEVMSSSGRAAPSPRQPENCRMEGVDAIYSFERLRIANDSAYVGTAVSEVRSGRPASSAICLVLLWRDADWTGVSRHNAGIVENCGK